ncbi:MAG: hypothetical protein KF715_14640 [Candidatus Didemnitutus sp.]|nr:hypothetical protein [Candidatus Didemnitutus sp.]
MLPIANTPASASQEPVLAVAVTTVPQINAFNWLLVLGFPPEIAAAAAHPETFAR